MELNKFLRLLYKRWWLLVTVPLISMAVTYFFVKDLPSNYHAQAIVATGLVDETQHSLSIGGLTFQESHVNQQFTNVVEMMKLKKIVDKVSYQLIIHDLTQPKPFRKPSKLIQAMTEAERKKTAAFFKGKYEQGGELNLWDEAEQQQYKVLKSVKYDEESLNSKLSVYRKSNSDYIQVDFVSESSELSPFVVNTLVKEFISSYDSTVQKNKGKTADFLAELLAKKYAAMNEKIALLREYKIQNKILNLYEQSKILYTHMLLVDSRKMEAQKDIEAFTGAISSIDSKFNPSERKYLEAALTKLNQDILVTKTNLYTLSDQYIKSGYEETIKRRMDSVKKELDRQVNALTDQYIYDPLSTKKDLMAQKLSLEVQRDIAQNSLNGLTKELEGFNGRFNRLVPFEAVIQSYERDIDIASREYLDILNKYNQLGMDPDDPVKLKQVQVAMPGQGAPTKKILFILAAGVITFVFCVLLLFVLFFFDKSVATPAELAQKTQLPVLGHLQPLSGTSLDLYNLWNGSAASNPEFAMQKELLRSIRYELAQELGDGKTVCITSLRGGQGASFVALNLAYAFATMRKRVLLIDGNFNDASVSKMVAPVISVEGLFNTSFIDAAGFITVAGNQPDARSAFEIASRQRITHVLETLPFDVVLIDGGPLESDHKIKEWAACADKVVAVFSHRQGLSEMDEANIAWLSNTGKFAGWIYNKYNVKA